MGKNCDSKARGDVAIGVRCHEGTDQWGDPSPWGQLLLRGFIHGPKFLGRMKDLQKHLIPNKGSESKCLNL